MTELVKVLMHRDGISEKEAKDIQREMIQRVWDGEDPEEVLYDEGLEPDYVFDILPRANFKRRA